MNSRRSMPLVLLGLMAAGLFFGTDVLIFAAEGAEKTDAPKTEDSSASETKKSDKALEKESYLIPSILSGVQASPNPATKGQEVEFTVGLNHDHFSGENIQWDFGDGITATGNTTVRHTYAVAGTYEVRCFLVRIGRSAVEGKTTVKIEESGAAALPPGEQLLFRHLAIHLNFSRSGKDRLTAKFQIPLPENFEPEGKTVTLQLGNCVREYTLNEKGRTGPGGLMGHFRMRWGSTQPGWVKPGWTEIRLHFWNDNIAEKLIDAGLSNIDSKNKLVELPVSLTLEGKTYAAVKGGAGSDPVKMAYTSKKDKSAKAKLIKK